MNVSFASFFLFLISLTVQFGWVCPKTTQLLFVVHCFVYLVVATGNQRHRGLIGETENLISVYMSYTVIECISNHVSGTKRFYVIICNGSLAVVCEFLSRLCIAGSIVVDLVDVYRFLFYRRILRPKVTLCRPVDKKTA